MELFAVSPDDASLWEKIISEFSEASVFHTWRWARTFAQAYGHKPCLCCLEDDSKIHAVMPVSIVNRPLGRKFAVSMPYSDFTGPLGNWNSDDFLTRLPAFLGVENLGIRTDIEFPSMQPSFFSTYRLELPDNPDGLLNKLSSKAVRYPIRKAGKDGLKVTEANREDIREFYRLMRITRSMHGVPTPPLSFYQILYKNLIETGNGSLLLARNIKEKVVAGSLFLWYEKKAYYKYSASEPSVRSSGPGHLLLWEGIKRAIERGCTVLDLGRVSAKNKGLAAFKRHWLGEESPLWYFSIGKDGNISTIEQNESMIERLVSGIIKSTPPSISGLAGKMIYRYFA